MLYTGEGMEHFLQVSLMEEAIEGNLLSWYYPGNKRDIEVSEWVV